MKVPKVRKKSKKNSLKNQDIESDEAALNSSLNIDVDYQLSIIFC